MAPEPEIWVVVACHGGARGTARNDCSEISWWGVPSPRLSAEATAAHVVKRFGKSWHFPSRDAARLAQRALWQKEPRLHLRRVKLNPVLLDLAEVV